MSDYQYFPAQVGLRLDKRNGRVSVLIRSDDFREPAEFSPKRDSGAEDVLKEALQWQRLLSLQAIEGASADGWPTQRRALLSVDDGTVEYRVEINLADRSLTWKTPRSEQLKSQMVERFSDLADFTDHAPDPEGYVVALDLRAGDTVLEDGSQHLLTDITHLGRSEAVLATTSTGQQLRWRWRAQVRRMHSAAEQHWVESRCADLKPGQHLISAGSVRRVEQNSTNGSWSFLELYSPVAENTMHLNEDPDSIYVVVSDVLAHMALAMGGTEEHARAARRLLNAGYGKI